MGITFIVVTHDQEEAMTLSTRIAVMDEGRFIQIGTPTDIYEYPQTRFVADFIGSVNMFEGRVIENGDDHVLVKASQLDVTFYIDHSSEVRENIGVVIAIRPEKITLSRELNESTGEHNCVRGIVDDIGYLGNFSTYKIELSRWQGH